MDMDIVREILESKEKLEEFDIRRILSHLYINESNASNKFYLLISFSCLIEMDENLPSVAASTFKNNNPILIFNSNAKRFLETNFKDEKAFIILLKHEINHLIALHPFRCYELVKDFPNMAFLANVIADGIINSNLKIPEELHPVTLNYLQQLLNQAGKEISIEKLAKMTLEEIFELFRQTGQKGDGIGKGDGIEKENISGKDNAGKDNESGKAGQGQDNSKNNPLEGDIKDPKNSSQEGSKIKIKELIEQASKAIGSTPGEVEEIIKSWKKVKKINLDVSPIFGFLRELDRTFSYPSNLNLIHKNLKYALPSYKKLKGIEILAIIDTSGSIGVDEAKFFFGILKMIAEKYNLDVVEIDTEIKDYFRFNSRINQLVFKGRGGTSFKALENLKKFTGKSNYNLILLLTDGYVNEFPEFNPYPAAKWFFITTSQIPKNLPRFFKVLKIEVENQE